ncbi:YdcF family protein [Sunxiuqinia sp. A32]|uniref:YdcF family protein n=1 Tax=Sunxiuqinia sp. A32 TaxID=3461496 RepID=UPI004045FA7A
MKVFYHRLIATFHVLLVTFGFVFVVSLILSFTTIPYYAYHWLGTSVSEIAEKPEYIVLLGGGGMPSESNLMRIYYTAHAAEIFPESKVIVSIPGKLWDEKSTPVLVGKELQVHGVDSARIVFEANGTNTRSQALNLRMFNGEVMVNKSILLVSSPEHLRRAVLSFQKAGFERVNALPAFENALEANLVFTDDKLGGNRFLVPDVGSNISIRYQFWNHLKYEIMVAREIVAMSYYKLRAWI